MEYIDGGDLKNLQKTYKAEGKNFPEHMVQKLLFQITKALKAFKEVSGDLHVFHRDIKPENILVTKDLERFVVTDFGMAKLHSLFDQTAAPSGINGTLVYIDPMVGAYQKEEDLIDLWSLSVMTFALLFERYPFGNIDSIQALTEYGQKASTGQYEIYSKEKAIVSPTAIDFLEKTLVPGWPGYEQEVGEKVRLNFNKFCTHPFISGYGKF